MIRIGISSIGIRTALRFLLPLLAVFGLTALALSPLVENIMGQWFRSDIEMRSRLVFHSVRDNVTDLLRQKDASRLTELFSKIATDERLLAIGLCDPKGRFLYAEGRLPSAASCSRVSRSDATGYSIIETEDASYLVATFPIDVDGARRGHVAIFHDLIYVRQRANQMRDFLILLMGGVGLATLAIMLAMTHITLRRWLQSVRAGLGAPGSDGTPRSPEIAPVIREIKQLMRDLDGNRRLTEDIRIQWAPHTLKLFLQNELPGDEVLVVSNREPYIHNRESNGAITLQTPASGLVAALEPVTVACAGTWIAHGSGSADADVVDSHNRISVPPSDPTYTLRRVWLSDEEQEGYYYGFANEGLWPLCHLAYVRPNFRESDWNYYVAVNQKFADAVVAEAKSPHPIVLVQDYHFALLPRMVRERLPDATIITFWHIPWPNAESFSICPWRTELLQGMLGSTILGFHTQFHCNNFLETVDRFLESRIDRERMSVTMGGTETLVRPYPISIDWPPPALAKQASVDACREAVRARFNLPSDIRLGVGIERFDYTKGILDRMMAVERLLERYPEWRGKFCFVQAAAPTRSKLAAYRNLQEEAMQMAEQINSRYGTEKAPAIILFIRHHEDDEVFELYRSADLCVVSSLHDGMNLVA